MPAPDAIALIFDLDNTLIHSTIDFMGTRRRLIGVLQGAGVRVLSGEEVTAL